MAIDPGDPAEREAAGAEGVLARALAAQWRGAPRLLATIDHFFTDEDALLDDASRARIASLLERAVNGLEREITRYAARLLTARNELGLAGALGDVAPGALARLSESGLLRDPELMAELIGRAGEERLQDCAALPADPAETNLLGRLIDSDDSLVAAAAKAFMLADSRRRGMADRASATDLPAELLHRLAWWTAAALRERFAPGPDAFAFDAALAEATAQSLAAHDEGDRVEAHALRLAATLDPDIEALSGLIVGALAERRPALAIALLARSLRIDYAETRALLLDREGDRLWVALRALGMPREAIARIGLTLADLDTRRDLERFADALDAIVSITPERAAVLLAPLRLHPDFRGAIEALEGRRGR